MDKGVLMVGFHFPPSALSSGHLRLLAFAKYLPEFGWKPLVLSATKGAYERIDEASIQSIPDKYPVYRAFALDAKRHLGLFGKYPSWLARPDRWSSWWPSAVLRGLMVIKRHNVRAIWSTYPIMTAHCVAYTLHRATGIPWIADFRDPVAASFDHAQPMTAKSQARWEGRVVRTATRSVFTTSGALHDSAARFPLAHAAGRLSVIGNGYDEAAFADLPPSPPPAAERPLVLLHSGLLYPDGRNPVPFFTALARLKASGSIQADQLKVVLRASGSEAVYARELQRLGLADLVVLAPRISNAAALAEQASADALLLFQGSRYDRQIPAKLYEYLRMGRPIFALLGQQGDTASLLRETGGAKLVPMDDVAAIDQGLAEFMHALRDGVAPRANVERVRNHSRDRGAAMLARVLDESVR